LALIHLFTPANTDDDVMDKGRVYLEKMMLNRSIGVKLSSCDEKGNFTGRIYHPGGDIASEILKQGFSKLNAPKDISQLDVEYFQTLKAAQEAGRSQSLNIWKGYGAE
jgi:endonuclease YncB( thermonuclease family)